MRLRRNLIYIIISLFSLTGYAQFSLAPNGVTIVCPGANSGDTGVVDGVTYTAVNSSLLRTKRIAGIERSVKKSTSSLVSAVGLSSIVKYALGINQSF